MIAPSSRPADSFPPANLTETQEDEHSVLVEIATGLGPRGSQSLFIGNQIAADDPVLLQETGITSSLNVAVNVWMDPLALPDGTTVRRTHIGLIDGAGNTPQHVLGAVLAVDGIFWQASPGKPHYPPHRTGNLLVHCRGGRSRSASVIALYLTLIAPEVFRSFDEAVNFIREKRQLDDSQPNATMMALGHAVEEMIKNSNIKLFERS